MNCPNHPDVSLRQALVAGVEVDYCPMEYGMWFDEGELQLAVERKDRDLRWLDIDLWKDPAKFKLMPTLKLSPKTRLPMHEVRYGDSNIKVDVCNLSHGIWLDRGEFKEILAYLEAKQADEVLHHYLENLAHETWEVFEGPEFLRDELLDLLALIKMLRYKFVVQHPVLSEAFRRLPA